MWWCCGVVAEVKWEEIWWRGAKSCTAPPKREKERKPQENDADRIWTVGTLNGAYNYFVGERRWWWELMGE
jgi:hypothetical protein